LPRDNDPVNIAYRQRPVHTGYPQ